MGLDFFCRLQNQNAKVSYGEVQYLQAQGNVNVRSKVKNYADVLFSYQRNYPL